MIIFVEEHVEVDRQISGDDILVLGQDFLFPRLVTVAMYASDAM